MDKGRHDMPRGQRDVIWLVAGQQGPLVLLLAQPVRGKEEDCLYGDPRRPHYHQRPIASV